MHYSDRVEDTTTTVGTGTFTTAESPPSGRRSFSVFPVGTNNIPYSAEDSAGGWEVGIGTRETSTTLTRDVVFASSTSGAKVDFGSGPKKLICTLPAEIFSKCAVDPDDVGFDIVLLAGQSNMKGDGTLDALVDLPSDRIWQWGCKSSDATRYQKITQALDPLSFNDTNAGKNGPGTWVARAYAATIPAHRSVLLIPAAVGGTGLLYGSTEWAAGDTLYTAAISQANAAISAAVALYPKSRFAGICWMQGEAESDSTAFTKSAYKAAFSSMLSGFRSGITGAADSWCVIGGMVPEKISASTNGANIDQAHQELAGEVAKVVYVAGPSGNTADNLHYNATGCRIIGSRMGLAVKAAIYELDAAFTPSVPGAPIIGTATAGNTQATVEFTPPASNGGATITGYTATSSPGGFTATGSASPLTVTGLSNGTAYTFTITATNSAGTGPASSASNSVTPSAGATVPGQVTGLTLGTATSSTQPLTWSAPGDGGSALTDYIVQWSPAGANTWTTFADGTSTTASATVTGLTASTSYDYRVAAVNSVGTGSYSATSTGSTAAASETTFNNADQVSGTWTLSGGDLVATRTGVDSGSYRSIRGNAGKSSGKLYFTMTTTATALLGVGSASADLSGFVGADANGWGLLLAYSAPAKFHGGGNSAISGVSTDAAHTWGIGVDFSTGELELFEDGTSKGVLYSSALGGQLSGTLYPMCSATSNGTAVTLDCTPTSVPSGYTAWG